MYDIYRRTILVSIVILTLLSGQAFAWGELAHYSINRDANKNSIGELSAAVAPDAFTGNLEAFVHAELPGGLYDPLGPYINSSWANGWMGHTIADRASHGTFLPGSPYMNSNNYLSAVGASTLLDHYKAEFGGDILSYWYKQGTVPKSVVTYPGQIGDALKSYDIACGTKHSLEYDPQNYLAAFGALYAASYAEQALIDYKLDKKLQLGDYFLLAWAKRYSTPYNKYYTSAVGNVTTISSKKQCLVNNVATNTIMDISTPAYKMKKIKIDAGTQLINKGLIKTHEKINKKTGAVTIDLESTVNTDQLAKEYLSNMENAYEKQTGKNIKILDEIKSDI